MRTWNRVSDCDWHWTRWWPYSSDRDGLLLGVGGSGVRWNWKDNSAGLGLVDRNPSESPGLASRPAPDKAGAWDEISHWSGS